MAWLLVWTIQVHGWIGPVQATSAIPSIASEAECKRLMTELRVRGRCVEYQMSH